MYATYPVYYPSWSEAKRNDELDLWKESFKINKEYRDYINDNASAAYHDRELPELIKNLTETFGLERAVFVTARFIVAADWDGRYDADVKERAARIDFRDMKDGEIRHIKRTSFDKSSELYSNVHPCILNEVFRSLMKMEQEQINLPSADADRENERGEGVEI